MLLWIIMVLPEWDTSPHMLTLFMWLKNVLTMEDNRGFFKMVLPYKWLMTQISLLGELWRDGFTFILRSRIQLLFIFISLCLDCQNKNMFTLTLIRDYDYNILLTRMYHFIPLHYNETYIYIVRTWIYKNIPFISFHCCIPTLSIPSDIYEKFLNFLSRSD